MSVKELKCPNCNASVSPVEYKCKYCGTYYKTVDLSWLATDNNITIWLLRLATSKMETDKKQFDKEIGAKPLGLPSGKITRYGDLSSAKKELADDNWQKLVDMNVKLKKIALNCRDKLFLKQLRTPTLREVVILYNEELEKQKMTFWKSILA